VKLFIAIDREGISGVVSEQDAEREGPAAKAAMRLMRADLDAVLAGCDAAGGGEIVVCDAHDDGRSLAASGLPQGVTLVGGSPAPYSMMQGIGAGYDGALFIGYHARAGAAGAVLEHTWNYKVFSAHVGDLEVGEFGVGAFLAGHFGVPALYASGDDKLAAEAEALVPGIVTTTVKRGLGRHAAELLPPNETQAMMREDVARALQSQHKPAPLAWSGAPMRLTFTRAEYCDKAAFCPAVRRLDGRTLEIGGATFEELYRAFLACLMLSELTD
jgi:D-amino peptidase